MPNLNGKGPQGQGPKTGKKRGRCAGKEKIQDNIDKKDSQQTKSTETNSEVTGKGRGRNAGGKKGVGGNRFRGGK
ncbi:MAG: DUF5320 domain-containing protein [Ignavibacteriaceae bacterium]